MNKPSEQLLSGKEMFTDNGKAIGLTVNDFWSFQFSNILHDPDEIAEFLVAKALGQDKPFNKDHWTLYDIDYNGIRVEVKETAYYHPFNKLGHLSKQRVFGITKANSNYEDPDKENHFERQNDIYVFCLLNGENEEEAWPLEVSHWEFYIVPTSTINKECGDQKTVSLSRVQSFTEAVDYSHIKDAIEGIFSSIR